MVATDEIKARGLDLFPDLRGLQVGELVLVCGCQMRNHTSVMAGDNDTAATGGLRGIDEVFGVDAGFLAEGAELYAVLIVANATDVEN